MTRKTVTAKKKKHLKALIRKAIKKDGYFCDLNFIDVSQITDLQSVFFRIQFQRRHIKMECLKRKKHGKYVPAFQIQWGYFKM